MQQMLPLKYGRSWDVRFHHTETVNDGNTSVPLRIPADTLGVLVAVATTSADVLFTNDDYATVDAGNADWYPWSEGSSTGNTIATLPQGVTAVKCSATGTGGSTKFTVTA